MIISGSRQYIYNQRKVPTIKKSFIIGLLLLSPTENISEIEIYRLNLDNLKALNNTDYGVIVPEITAAAFDVNNLPNIDLYGRIIETSEHLRNIELPSSVVNTISKLNPNHSIKKDTFLVRYPMDLDINKKYKILLISGEGKSWVKFDENFKSFVFSFSLQEKECYLE